MASVSYSNARIAKNSIIVYVRLFITTIIGLFTARYVLKALGASDYGLYFIVGGVVALFAVISGSMSSTTIRFLNVEIGKPDGNPNKVFNICQVTHILFALLVLLLAETLGLLYIYKYLNVEPGKIGDAAFVFQVSTLVACIGLVNIPYQSVFIAKEKFAHIAVIDIINASVKLVFVILLLHSNGNRLRQYALIMSFATLFSFIAYHYLCYRYWPELVKWKFYKNPNDYKEVVVYNNYNLLASVALMGRSQGSNILINYFFGTIVNGAFGIARTVQSFVEIFSVNFDSAAAPQITQSIGSGDIEKASSLACRVCRMCQLLSLLIIFPLFVEMELILKIWLGIVPENTVLFCRVMLITVAVSSTGGGILRLKDAMGKIKWFMITYSIWYLLTLPIGFLLFKKGFPPVTILVLFVLTDIICRITQLILMKIVYKFDIIPFCKSAYTRPLIVVTLMTTYALLYNSISIRGDWIHLGGLIITSLIGALLVGFIGLKRNERESILKYCLSKIHK